MEAIILNTVYKFNDLNPVIELYINNSPYLLKIKQTYFSRLTSLKSIHIEKLIGSKIKFEFLEKGEILNAGSSDKCKYANSYFKFLEFDLSFISKNENEICFSKVTRKEFHFAKESMDPFLANYYTHMYVPKLNLYSNTTLIGKIDILNISNFYTSLLSEINIFRIEGCSCENCLEKESDNIDISIDFRIEVSELKYFDNLLKNKKEQINSLYKRLHEKSHQTFQTLDYGLLEELKSYIEFKNGN